MFAHARLLERHDGLLKFQIASESLADIFEKLEHYRDEWSISNYSVSQPSLEQIFLEFAAAQK
jgi:ABC-type uncharacterized transport system ATPase subunit